MALLEAETYLDEHFKSEVMFIYQPSLNTTWATAFVTGGAIGVCLSMPKIYWTEGNN